MLADDCTIFLGHGRRAERRRLRLTRRASDRASLRRLPRLDRRQPVPRSARDARPPPLHRIAARERRAAAGAIASIASTTPTRAKRNSSRTTNGSRRSPDARAPAVHVARVPLPARRASLGGDRQRRDPDGGAYRASVPIFCPAIADSSIGMGLSQARHRDPAAGPRRCDRRHHRVGEPGDPPAAHRVGRARRRHAEELHQPGDRAGGVLRRRGSAGTATRCRSSPTCRTSAARRARPSRRRRAGASSPPTPSRSRCTPTRPSRCPSSSARWPRARRDAGVPEAAALRSFGPVMAVDGRPLSTSALRGTRSMSFPFEYDHGARCSFGGALPHPPISTTRAPSSCRCRRSHDLVRRRHAQRPARDPVRRRRTWSCGTTSCRWTCTRSASSRCRRWSCRSASWRR